MPKLVIYVICAFLAMGTNIILGTAIADFNEEFNKEKAILGLKKAGAIIVSGAALYLIGQLAPEVTVESFGLSLSDALVLIAYSVVLVYVGKDIDNLLTLLKIKINDHALEEI